MIAKFSYPNKETIHLFEQAVCSRRQINFELYRNNALKIGMNTAAYKFYHVNKQIGLDTLNMKFVHLKKLMKFQFLKMAILDLPNVQKSEYHSALCIRICTMRLTGFISRYLGLCPNWEIKLMKNGVKLVSLYSIWIPCKPEYSKRTRVHVV